MKQYYIKAFTFTVFLFSLIFTVNAQNSDKLWSKTVELEKNTSKIIKRQSTPTSFEAYQLNLKLFKENLINAPKRKGKSTTSNTILSFPNEKGIVENYQIFETSILEESLQKKYPTIKSYIGKGIENPNAVVRFSITKLGLHAMISQKGGKSIYIDPYTSEADSYIFYTKNNLAPTNNFECKFDEVNVLTKIATENESQKTENANDGILRTFRLAVATTGEYSQFHLNNQNISDSATDAEKKGAVLSAIVATVTRVNEIFEKDVALTMVLVANNTDIIFLDGPTDPFTNNNSSALINESQTVIDANIGTANYDIGHTFSTGAGGLASLNVPCTSSKARGVTGTSSPIGDPYDVDFVAHEMGHQYGATHTFNNSCNENRTGSTAVEPGSGSTIMSYAGICAPNVQNAVGAYFHYVSIQQMWNNISIGNSTCGTQSSIPTNVNAPTADDLSNHTIPVSTPFVLNVNATDLDGDALTYTWEQLDTEITTAPPVSTAAGGPVFRSLLPTSSSARYFPDLSTVLAGDLANTWEVLPSVSRTMNFGVTIRDNNINGGQTASKETTIIVDNASGPFNVTSQNVLETWYVGTSKTINWNVANTNVSPVNCSNVTISLSIDGGNTYPFILASNVINDGSHDIVVPNTITTMARVKVESVGNVFYAINQTNFVIEDSEFVMNFDNFSKTMCAPGSVVYNFTYNTPVNTFAEEIVFSANDLPLGSIATFNPVSAITDNTDVTMTISGIGLEDVENYTINVTGSSTSSSVSKSTIVTLGVFSSVINATNLTLPENNNNYVLSPYTLSWEGDVNVSNYIIEISLENTFSTIYEASPAITSSSYIPETLQPNTTYYWRVKRSNNCTVSSFSEIFNFKTAPTVCDINNSLDTPLLIPDNNELGVSSIINITQNKQITDVNVTVNITHPWDGDLTLILISPSGTEVNLAANIGSDGNNFTNTVFDDEGITSINSVAAPFTGTYRPQGSLASFNNEESYGEWIIKIVDAGAEDVGEILNWNIEICGAVIISDDDDKDSVVNANDICPNTPLGSTVDAFGCSTFSVPSTNFSIEAVSETCPNENNGKIIINSTVTHDYFVIFNKVKYNFTNTLTFNSLSPGIYTICINVTGGLYQQCFDIEVIEGEQVVADATVNFSKVAIEIKAGTAPYTIYVNGEENFKTSSSVFNVDVKHGDLVEVKTAKPCEGTFSKTIELLDGIVAYPNPTNGIFDIALPVSQKEVVIELYSIQSQLISIKTYPIVYGKVQLTLENQPTGLYFVKVHLESPITVKIIKK